MPSTTIHKDHRPSRHYITPRTGPSVGVKLRNNKPHLYHNEEAKIESGTLKTEPALTMTNKGKQRVMQNMHRESYEVNKQLSNGLFFNMVFSLQP